MNERLTSIPQHALAGALFTVLLIGTPAFAVMPTAGASPTSVSASSASAIDIRDIRGPIPISSAWLWSMWVAGGVTLGLSAIGAWRWNRQRKRVAAQPAFELALERLRAARALMQPPTVREFSITVSDIVRSYIEERFQVMAAHRTHRGISPRSSRIPGRGAHSPPRLTGGLPPSLRPRQIRRLEFDGRGDGNHV
jgi:hypothetical protein